MDIAELGFRIRSDQAVTADRRLDRLRQTSGRVERQTTSLIRSVGLLGAAFGAAFSLTSSIAQARQLDAAIGELSTLIPGATRDLEAMTEASSAFGRSFGTGSRAQAQAFYAAVSAGATDSAVAIARVDAANRLAIGGAADLGGSVAILNAATNAYADSGLTAADASDILFTGVRTGVTTINELSNGLGRAIPIASALGIGLDELVGGVAALTTQGQSTELAVTGIRAALNATLQPSQQAAELADRLGISFNSAAVESMGFLGFMQHVAERTGGSRDALTTLFGSVEAGTAVLSLAGQGGVRFAEIMDQMADRAGAADEAYEAMASRISTRWNVVMATAAERAERLGMTMLSGIVPAAEQVILVLEGSEEASLALEIAMKAVAVTAGVLLVQNVGSAAASMIAASAATGIWSTALQLLTVRGGAAIVMSQALGAAVRFALGPIGLVITAVGLLTTAWVAWSRRVRETRPDIEQIDQDLEGIAEGVDEIRAANNATLGIQGVIEQIGTDAQGSIPQVRRLAEEMQGVTEQMVLQALAAKDARVNQLLAFNADLGDDLAETRREAERLRAELENPYRRIRDGSRTESEVNEELARVETTIREIETQRARIQETLRTTGQTDIRQFITEIRDALSGGGGGGSLPENLRETGDAVAYFTGLIPELSAAQIKANQHSGQYSDLLYEQGQVLRDLQGPSEDYKLRLEAISSLLAAGSISQSQFNMQLRQAQSDMLQGNVSAGQATWIEGILAGLDTLAMRSQNVAASMRDAFSSAAESISSGIGNAVGRSIVYAESLGSAILDVARNAVAQLISSFVQLGIQWLVNAAIGQSVAKAATAASVAEGILVAKAWAPAAAAVSLASFGANSIPAMAGIASAYALSAGLGKLPGLNTGGSIMVGGNAGIDRNVMSINGSPVARVGQGERIDVIPRSAANDRGANDGGINVSVGTINAGSDVSRQEVMENIRLATEQAIIQSTRISARDTQGKLERLARPQISAGRG